MSTVGILIFDKVEVLDFCGPYEVLSVTRLTEEQRQSQPSPYRLLLVAERETPVTTIGGMRVLPDVTCAACPKLDVLIVPGGAGTRREIDNPALLEWIRARAREVSLLASVCTGSLMLGKAGLLDGRRATSHWAWLEGLGKVAPETRVIADEHVVMDGSVWTSAGISAGIDLALRLVARDHGEAVARAPARRQDYPYPEDNQRRT